MKTHMDTTFTTTFLLLFTFGLTAARIGKRSYPKIEQTTRIPIYGEQPHYDNKVDPDYDDDYYNSYYYQQQGAENYYNGKEAVYSAAATAGRSQMQGKAELTQISHSDTNIAPGNSNMAPDVHRDTNIASNIQDNINIAPNMQTDGAGRQPHQPQQSQQFFKEGRDPVNGNPYGFTDGGAGSAGVIVNDGGGATGLPFLNNQDSQLLTEPFQFHGSGYRSNNHQPKQKPRPGRGCKHPDDTQYYCEKLKDGRYFDPWNPLCGFIDCVRGKTIRGNCAKGTWMGMSKSIRYNLRQMCKKPVKNIGADNTCPELTDFQDLCINASREAVVSTDNHDTQQVSQQEEARK